MCFHCKTCFFFIVHPSIAPTTRCNTLSMLKSQLSLCGTGLNHRRLQQSMLLSKTWKKLFSWIKMDSRKYSMYMLFLSDSGRCFYSMYRFFYRFREMFLRPKLSILYSMYPITIIHIYIYIYYIYTRVFAHICTIWRGKHSNCWNAGKNNFQGNRSICGNAGRKQFQGGSIPTAEMFV